MISPKEGDLSVWWVPQVPMQEFRVPVSSPEQGAFLLNTLAEYDAFQFLCRVKPDYCNSGGLDVFEDGEWCSWQDPETFEDDPGDAHPQPSLGWCEGLPS